jgi:hypothetical protein
MMKKAEAKTTKAKKTTGAVKKVKSSTATKGTTVRRTKAEVRKVEPTDEEISRKAYELYNQRISRGEYGTPAEDWHKAVELLKKSSAV